MLLHLCEKVSGETGITIKHQDFNTPTNTASDLDDEVNLPYLQYHLLRVNTTPSCWLVCFLQKPNLKRQC